MQVSANLFDTLGVPPARGRTFDASDDQPAPKHVVVLSYQLWQRRFASDPGIVCQQILLNGDSYTVTGVMPQTFRFAPFSATSTAIWTPLVLDKLPPDRRRRAF